MMLTWTRIPVCKWSTPSRAHTHRHIWHTHTHYVVAYVLTSYPCNPCMTGDIPCLIWFYHGYHGSFQLPTSSGRSEDIFVTRTTPRATGGCWPPWSISTRTGSRVMAGNCGSSTQELPVIPMVQGWHFWNSGRVFWIFLMFLCWWGWSGRVSCSLYFCVPFSC